jgi:hypothetical protein
MIRYVIRTYVENVSEQHRTISVKKDAVTGEMTSETESLGWFIRLRGSQEQLHVGWQKPDLAIGDQVKITIEKEI